MLSVAWTLSVGHADETWVIPTWQHAFDKQQGASYEDRFAMCERAFVLLPGVKVLDIEKRLGGVSRTLHTLQALKESHPDTELRLLIGADLLPTTDRWHRWDQVSELAPPIVVGRQGYEGGPVSSVAIPNINSTDIRGAISRGDDVQPWVPAEVLEYISAKGLYEGET